MSLHEKVCEELAGVADRLGRELMNRLSIAPLLQYGEVKVLVDVDGRNFETLCTTDVPEFSGRSDIPEHVERKIKEEIVERFRKCVESFGEVVEELRRYSGSLFSKTHYRKYAYALFNKKRGRDCDAVEAFARRSVAQGYEKWLACYHDKLRAFSSSNPRNVKKRARLDTNDWYGLVAILLFGTHCMHYREFEECRVCEKAARELRVASVQDGQE